jgi:uncharacterized protein (DUF1697 family)
MTVPRTYAALLRGINVGGARKVQMTDLADVFDSLGHVDVRTYIQSGNVVFRSSKAERTIATALEAAIDTRFGLDIRVMLRSHDELIAIAAGNPFPEAAAEPKRLHVVFLDRAPAKGAIGRVEPERSPGDSFELAGRDLYLHLPDGAGRTTLTLGYLEKRLGVAGTQRNWNTLLKLIALTEPAADG